jgi:hypothetical protein
VILELFCLLLQDTGVSLNEPELTVVVEEYYSPGDIILIEAKSKDAKFFTWQATGDSPSDKPIIVNATERSVVVRSAVGKYHIYCAAGNETGITSTVVTINVRNGFGPNPPPDPEPKPVQDFYGLVKLSYEAGNKIQSPSKRSEAEKIAKNHRIVADLTSQKGQTIEPLLIKLRELNRSSLQEYELNRWDSWASTVKTAMLNLAKDNKLVTLEDHNKAFIAIATGLEMVK